MGSGALNGFSGFSDMRRIHCALSNGVRNTGVECGDKPFTAPLVALNSAMCVNDQVARFRKCKQYRQRVEKSSARSSQGNVKPRAMPRTSLFRVCGV